MRRTGMTKIHTLFGLFELSRVSQVGKPLCWRSHHRVLRFCGCYSSCNTDDMRLRVDADIKRALTGLANCTLVVRVADDIVFLNCVLPHCFRSASEAPTHYISGQLSIVFMAALNFKHSTPEL